MHMKQPRQGCRSEEENMTTAIWKLERNKEK